MTKDEILAVIKRVAAENGGQPLGERTFYKETGLNVRALQRAGFPNYGSARSAAGFARGVLTEAYSDDKLFAPLARLVREKQRFPTQGEITVAQHSIGGPSYDTYRRVKNRGPLPQQLLDWCRTQDEFSDVVSVLDSTPKPQSSIRSPARGSEKVVTGYVYLLRYGTSGKDYKIGCTDNVGRRESQIDMMSPTDVRRVHVIETDDPRGIERYWQERFAEKRVKTKEIFRLSADDVAAFRRRKYQ